MPILCLIAATFSVSCLTPQGQPHPTGDQFILRIVTDSALAPLLDFAHLLPRHSEARIVTLPHETGGAVAVEYRLANLRRHAVQQPLGKLLTLKKGSENTLVVTLSLSIVRTSFNLAATPFLPPTRPSSREELYLYYSWTLGGRWNEAELRRILERTAIEIIVIPSSPVGLHQSSPAIFRRSIPFVEFVLSGSQWRYEVPIGRTEERS